MPRGPKFSLFRPCVEPSSFSKTNGDKLGLLSAGDGDAGQNRKANLKLAWFFATVAVLFVLADQLGRVEKQTNANLASDSTALVSLKVWSPVRFGNGSGFSMRFRLSNRGNHSVFYPINTTTSAPVGQLVARTSPASDWASLSSASNERVAAVRNFADQNLTWIEMPPGGWVDGEFPDTVGRAHDPSSVGGNLACGPAFYTHTNPASATRVRIAAARFAQNNFSILLDTQILREQARTEISPFEARLPLRSPRAQFL